MISRSKLVGSVKPYFGRSIRPKIVVAVRAVHAELSSDRAETVDLATPSRLTLREAVLEAARGNGWLVLEDELVCDIVVPVDEGRTQGVTVRFDQSNEIGQRLIVYSSQCGPASKKYAMALLRRNATLMQSAFAIEKLDDGELIVLRGVQPAYSTTAAEATKMIEAIAKSADRIERKLLGTDEF